MNERALVEVADVRREALAGAARGGGDTAINFGGAMSAILLASVTAPGSIPQRDQYKTVSELGAEVQRIGELLLDPSHSNIHTSSFQAHGAIHTPSFVFADVPRRDSGSQPQTEAKAKRIVWPRSGFVPSRQTEVLVKRTLPEAKDEVVPLGLQYSIVLPVTGEKGRGIDPEDSPDTTLASTRRPEWAADADISPRVWLQHSLATFRTIAEIAKAGGVKIDIETTSGQTVASRLGFVGLELMPATPVPASRVMRRQLVLAGPSS